MQLALQLNLLSMEEGQRSVERQDSTVPSAGPLGTSTAACSAAAGPAGEKSTTASAKAENLQLVRDCFALLNGIVESSRYLSGKAPAWESDHFF